MIFAFLLVPSLAAAEDYHVKPDVHEAQGPGNYGPGYDCAGPTGPNGAVESVGYNVDGLTDGTRWGLPYFEPSCFAADARFAPPHPGGGGGDPGAGDASGLCGRGVSSLAWRIDCRWTARAVSTGFGGSGSDVVFDLLDLSTAHSEIRVRATYNLSSGRYYVGLDTAAPAGMWNDIGTEVMGDTGVGILLNCRECSPPWE